MVNYLSDVYKAYFNTLKRVGYINDKKIASLLIMNFIHEILEGNYKDIIPEKEYAIFERGINCLYGNNCMMPYMDYFNNKLHITRHSIDIVEGDLPSEIQSIVDKLKADIDKLKNQKVIKSKEYIKDVNDIQL